MEIKKVEEEEWNENWYIKNRNVELEMMRTEDCLSATN